MNHFLGENNTYTIHFQGFLWGPSNEYTIERSRWYSVLMYCVSAPSYGGIVLYSLLDTLELLVGIRGGGTGGARGAAPPIFLERNALSSP